MVADHSRSLIPNRTGAIHKKGPIPSKFYRNSNSSETLYCTIGSGRATSLADSAAGRNVTLGAYRSSDKCRGGGLDENVCLQRDQVSAQFIPVFVLLPADWDNRLRRFAPKTGVITHDDGAYTIDQEACCWLRAARLTRGLTLQSFSVRLCQPVSLGAREGFSKNSFEVRER
jgi:hypothetical protein